MARKSLEGARPSGKGKGFMEDRLFPKDSMPAAPTGIRQIIAYLIDRTSQDCGSYTARSLEKSGFLRTARISA
jgi:hypothetical protein